MQGSYQRVQKIMNGEKPDRVPLFDLFFNDAVLAHFNGGQVIPVGDKPTAIAAVARAVDGSRTYGYAPDAPATKKLPDGREIRYERWTFWREHLKFDSPQEYSRIKFSQTDKWLSEMPTPDKIPQEPTYLDAVKDAQWFGPEFYFVPGVPGVCLMAVHVEVGLEDFSYYLCDCEDAIIKQLDAYTEYACRFAQGIRDDRPFETVFIGDDIAFKTGPMISPLWLRKHYFPRLARVIDAYHRNGIKVLFHSDGNLNQIMDDLVAAGIDALNPIEVAAGMDIADLHRRYPKLIFVGGIDVSQLLPYGTPKQIKDATTKAIEDSQGQILVGSSTEIFDLVPLENFLALRETAMNFRF